MEVTRLFDLLDNYLENFPEQDAALVCKRNGVWQKFGIQKYVELTNYMSYGMLKLGIKPGDNVGIVSSNRPEWNMLDFAIMQIGAISIPIYPTISQDDYRHILNHAEMKMIFIEGKELGKKLKPIFLETKTLKHVFTFNEQDIEYQYLDQLIGNGIKYPEPEKLIKLKAEIKPND